MVVVTSTAAFSRFNDQTLLLLMTINGRIYGNSSGDDVTNNNSSNRHRQNYMIGIPLYSNSYSNNNIYL